MQERLLAGRVQASVADAIDAVDLLPPFELAAVAVLEGTERPGEEPPIRRRLRAEGIRASVHRGVLLLLPGELDRLCSVGLLNGTDEVYLVSEWQDEFEVFPGRISSDLMDFEETTPLGLEEWMVDSGCLIALGDGAGLNFATLDGALAEQVRRRFPKIRPRSGEPRAR